MLSERLGKWSFWLVFVGFNLTFFPMHFLGVMGMVRRIYTYPDLPGWSALNSVATFGAIVQTAGILVFLANVVSSTRKRVAAGDNPWDAYSLEWATTSPPPELNFTAIAPVRSERPAFDLNHPDVAEVTKR
jgi:heme/copper-type cytochrome/quinol oxidase subunit 1